MVSSVHVTTTVALTSAAGLVLVVVVLWQLKKRREARIPEKWRRIGTVTDVALYPLKSGAAVHLDTGVCTERGLRTTSDHQMQLQDRLFVIIGSNGHVRNASQIPELFLIKVHRADEWSVTFQAPKMDDLIVRIPKAEEMEKIIITMWRDEKIPGLDCGDEAARWVQKFLDKEGMRLVFYAESLQIRDYTVPPLSVLREVYPNYRPQDIGAYGNYSSFMVLNQASVADLKKRLDDRAPPSLDERWFRPNFVVSGPGAYEEDNWKFLRIGDSAVFQVLKPCTRCMVITIDPLTAQRTKDMEPLRTLRKYRLITDRERLKFELATAPCMGVYVGLRRPGHVRVGDAIYVPDEQNK